jgi:hypothetical protein
LDANPDVDAIASDATALDATAFDATDLDGGTADGGGDGTVADAEPAADAFDGDGAAPPLCANGCSCAACAPACGQGSICASGVCVPTSLYVVATGIAAPTRPYYAGASVVFADLANAASATIYVLSKSGGPPRVLASGEPQAGSPITDGTYAYWTRAGDDAGFDVVRAPLDGSAPATPILLGSGGPLLTVDDTTLFFNGPDGAWSMPKDGSAPPTVFTLAIHVDISLYNAACWAPTDTGCYSALTPAFGGLGTWWTLTPWATDTLSELTGEEHGAFSLSSDQKTAFFYGGALPAIFLWDGPYPGGVQSYDRQPYPGASPTASSCGVFGLTSGIGFMSSVGSVSQLAGLPTPTVLAVDVDSDALYWNDPVAGTLMRAPLH